MPRRRFDFHETPPHYITALLNVIGNPKHSLIYEPCVGRGAIVHRLNGYGNRIYTNDIDPRRAARWHRDATKGESWGELGFDWIITNPPFSHAREILEHALRFGKNVAFLTRLSFLEPTLTRKRFWKRYALGVEVIILPRYSFRKNDQGRRGNDSMTCCWVIWRKRSTKSRRRIFISHRRAA